MKKVISLLMVCIFMLTALVACGNNSNDETVATTVGESETLGTDEFSQPLFESAVPEDLDFEGYELLILSRQGKRINEEWYKEEVGEDILDMAIERRNSLVALQLKMTFRLEIIPNNGNWDQMVEDFNNTVLNDIATTGYYDLYSHQAFAASYNQLRGAQANLLDKERLPYFDFDLPCWNQALVNTAINGKLFYIAGDANITLYDCTLVCWHNKTLYDNVKTDSDPEDLQDLAIAGDWTYDELYRWADMRIDDASGKVCDATYGIDDFGGNFYWSLVSAWDLNFITKTSDGKLQFNLDDNVKAENALSDIRYLRNKKGVLSCTGCGNFHFTEGQTMFRLQMLYTDEEACMMIRDMDDKFCVLPIPKYSAEQKEYKTSAAFNFNLVSVLNQNDDKLRGEEASAFYQLMTELSYTDVRATYIERIVKPRFFGADDEDGTVSKSIQIFDDLMDNVVIGCTEVYTSELNNIMYLWYDGIDDKTATLAEGFERNNYSQGGIVKTREQYEAALKSFNNYMWDIEE